MNVLMLSTDRTAFTEGSAVRERFRNFGTIVDTLYIIVRTPKGYRAENIAPNVFLYPTNSPGKLQMLFDWLRLGKKIPRPDLVTAEDPFETGLVAWRLARFHRSTLELQVHTDFLSPYFRRSSLLNLIRAYLARFLLLRADGIRVVSERIKKSLSHMKPRGMPRVLPVFIDAEKAISVPVAPSLRSRYPEFDFIVLAVGRLEPEKNISLALRSMARVIKEYPRTGFLIAGDGSERRFLEKEATSLGIDQNVIFLGWQGDIRPYYKAADLLLGTSDYEGYGLALVEAALASLPMVTTEVGVAGELFKDGEGALVCPVGGEKCLSKKILLAIGDPELRKRLKRTALALALGALHKNRDEYLAEQKKIWEATSRSSPAFTSGPPSI